MQRYALIRYTKLMQLPLDQFSSACQVGAVTVVQISDLNHCLNAPSSHSMLPNFAFLAYCWWQGAWGYVPATPSNDTNTAVPSGVNLTDVSTLHLRWYREGSYTQTVSYELVKTGSVGISQGAFVHFSEVVVRNDSSDSTTTPWIALVACDFNATQASQEDDIFALARDQGAFSEECIINPAYSDTKNSQPAMDMYSTESLASARLVNSQFAAFDATIYGPYDPQQLNNSRTLVNDTLQAGHPTAPGYLWATLTAWNATAGPSITNASSTGMGQRNGGRGRSSSESIGILILIVLYTTIGSAFAIFFNIIIV